MATDFIASFYPSLSERQPLPAYYNPACFILSWLPFLIPNKRLAILATCPILLYFCLHWPYFTTGDPSSDYYNGSTFVALPLWYLDFIVFTPRDDLAFVGPQAMIKKREGPNTKAQRWENLTTFSQRLKWTIRLMLPAQRGIGWNWQVKGVPADVDAKLPKWNYVGKQAVWSVIYYAQSVVTMTMLGFGMFLREHARPEKTFERTAANTVVGWAGAIWVWDRLCCAYCLAAALGVAVGLSDTWEWPPLMGRLGDAWSVRQMWSVTYHQACRRLLSQPSARITRFLGLRKGSTTSRYTQLFLSFGVSCLFHKAQMFNVTRKDMGELAFFMSQPAAIVIEDIIQWIWKQSSLAGASRKLDKFAGYVWTFAWFSLTLRMYVGGLVEAGVVKDWISAYEPLDSGARVGRELLKLSGA